MDRRDRARGPRARRARASTTIPGSCSTTPTRRSCRAGPAPATTRWWAGCSTPASRSTPAASTTAPPCTTPRCGAGRARSRCCWPAAPRRTPWAGLVSIRARHSGGPRGPRAACPGAADRLEGHLGAAEALLAAGAHVDAGMLELAADDLAALLEAAARRSGLVHHPGLEYAPGRPVRVRVRRRGERGHRVDLDDLGGAVALAGRPAGWRAAAERTVAELGWNVSRDGVVFMRATLPRDLDALVRRRPARRRLPWPRRCSRWRGESAGTRARFARETGAGRSLRAPMRQLPAAQDRQRSPFPPIADYGFLSDCETDRAGRAERQRRVAVPAAAWTRRACSARSSTATPGCFRLGPADVDGARRAALPAGHDGARDELGHARRLDHRARRAADRPVAPRRTSARTPTAARRPTTTPTTCCCARCAASTARCRSTLDCEPVFDYGRVRGAVGVRRRRLPRGGRAAPTADVAAAPHHRPATSASRGRARPRGTLMKEGDTLLLRAVVERAPAAAHLRRGLRAAGVDRAPLAALARPRRVPRPPVAAATSSAAR